MHFKLEKSTANRESFGTHFRLNRAGKRARKRGKTKFMFNKSLKEKKSEWTLDSESLVHKLKQRVDSRKHVALGIVCDRINSIFSAFVIKARI